MIMNQREKMNAIMKQNKENQLKYLDQMKKIMENSDNEKMKRVQM